MPIVQESQTNNTMHRLIEMLLCVPMRRCDYVYGTASCIDGVCTCVDPLPVDCNEWCVDTNSDSSNCGACYVKYVNELLPLICILTDSFDVACEKGTTLHLFLP
jgi:hypothetical protein